MVQWKNSKHRGDVSGCVLSGCVLMGLSLCRATITNQALVDREETFTIICFSLHACLYSHHCHQQFILYVDRNYV